MFNDFRICSQTVQNCRFFFFRSCSVSLGKTINLSKLKQVYKNLMNLLRSVVIFKEVWRTSKKFSLTSSTSFPIFSRSSANFLEVNERYRCSWRSCITFQKDKSNDERFCSVMHSFISNGAQIKQYHDYFPQI